MELSDFFFIDMVAKDPVPPDVEKALAEVNAVPVDEVTVVGPDKAGAAEIVTVTEALAVAPAASVNVTVYVPLSPVTADVETEIKPDVESIVT